jgi:hypothetical protein
MESIKSLTIYLTLVQKNEEDYNEDHHNLCWCDYVKVDVGSVHQDPRHPEYGMLIGSLLEMFRRGFLSPSAE